MDIQKYNIQGKEATLYTAGAGDSPLVVLPTYMGDGSSVVDAVRARSERPFNLLCVGNLNWDHDMTPWYCPPLADGDTPCTGGADEYLEVLLSEILPKALGRLGEEPAHISIAGYSLAGLFTLYALYRTDRFDRAASMSGSLWFPDFKEYVLSHDMVRQPERMYLSLGDKEAKVRHRLLRTVQDNTESLVRYYKEKGIEVTWELNPGNHYQDAAERSAKGIIAMI